MSKVVGSIKISWASLIVLYFPQYHSIVEVLLQSIDLNPIEIVKLSYRNKLFLSIVTQENIAVENVLKYFYILDAAAKCTTQN